MFGLSSCEEGENVEHKIINKPSGLPQGHGDGGGAG